MHSFTLLPYLDDKTFLQFVEEMLNIGFDALLKPEEKFDKNVIDPFSMLFEAASFGLDKQDWIMHEKSRQAQKTLSNGIGIFHQKILGALDGWVDLGTKEIVDIVNDERRIIAEIKNKYNTIKASDKIGLYDTFKNLVLVKTGKYYAYQAYYVEVIPKNPARYEKMFAPSDRKTGHKAPENELIRQMDGASFYALATGHDNALALLYKALPKAIDICLRKQGKILSKIDKSAFQEYFIKAYGGS